MKKRVFAFCAAGLLCTSAAFAKEPKVKDRLDASEETLTEMTDASDHGIPQNLLSKARCVVVVPGMKKAGFVFGGKYGRGFAACRDEKAGGWTAPAAMRIEGGSFGLQIGVAETDILLLVMNERGMKHLLSDKFTVGGDASASAGPLGREATAQTDALMHAEILSYSRSRGLFAGISLEGATLRPDDDANREMYGREVANRAILQGEFKTPPVAKKFEYALNRQPKKGKR